MPIRTFNAIAGAKPKNRMHLDLRPADRTREQETERILTLGASQLADHRRPDGSGWITLADPEGNEFCILSNTATAFVIQTRLIRPGQPEVLVLHSHERRLSVSRGAGHGCRPSRD